MKTLLALNTDLASTILDGKAPEWVELIPAGPNVIGRDGRSWLFDEPAQQLVQSSFVGRAVDLPIDWEHATQRCAPQGQAAPAGAWINQLEIRDGALWGAVQWTPRGADQVINREYRFLSPVFDYDPDSTRIVRLVSAGLTNKPNFLLTALNQEAVETQPVNISPATLALLGLAATATDAEVAAAVNKLTALSTAANAERPNLEQFVPREDYETLRTRATNAEQALEVQKKAEHNKAVEAALTAATQAGKITPATIEYHRAMCSDQQGLDRFQVFVAAAPVVAAPSNLGERQPDGTLTALNAEERQVAALMGMSEADFVKAKA